MSFLKYAPGVMGSALHDNSRGAEEIRGDECGWYGTEKCYYVKCAKAAVGEVLNKLANISKGAVLSNISIASTFLNYSELLLSSVLVNRRTLSHSCWDTRLLTPTDRKQYILQGISKRQVSALVWKLHGAGTGGASSMSDCVRRTIQIS